MYGIILVCAYMYVHILGLILRLVVIDVYIYNPTKFVTLTVDMFKKRNGKENTRNTC